MNNIYIYIYIVIYRIPPHLEPVTSNSRRRCQFLKLILKLTFLLHLGSPVGHFQIFQLNLSISLFCPCNVRHVLYISLYALTASLQWPPLCSSGQGSWLQMRRSGFDFRRYQIFWEVVGLERGPLSLVSTIEELLGRKSSGSDLEIRGYCQRNPSPWQSGTLYPQNVGTNFADKRQSLDQ
jgi:hypothetical protein